MLFLTTVRVVLSIFYGLLSLVPTPSMPAIDSFVSALSSFFQSIPQAFGLINLFVGPVVFNIFKVMFATYLLGLDFFAICFGFYLLQLLWGFLKGFFPG